MIVRLVLASIRQRPGRSLLLLMGYALGVGVTIALLSIGGALVTQAQDRRLLGGGDLAVLPAGIDLETLKTGGVSSMYFTIDQAPFLYREVLASPRFEAEIAAVAPWIDDELVYVERDGELVAASAGGLVPSAANALGAAPEIVAGGWDDVHADRVWMRPTDAELYPSLDGLHLPTGEAAGDSTWAEWHYFNVLLPDDAGWLYLTYMVAGAVSDGRWGGRMLATLVRPGLPERVYSADYEAADVGFAAGRPDLRIAASTVRIDEGVYRLSAIVPAASPSASASVGSAGPSGSGPAAGGDTLRVDLTIAAASRRYVPPLDIGGGAFPSGYTVPLLDARATGRICSANGCTEIDGTRAYHDHNWGVWERVTWDWGQAYLGDYSILYGSVARSDGVEGSRFLYVADRDGFGGVYPIRDIGVEWPGSPSPSMITVVAGRDRDSLHLAVTVRSGRVTPVPVAGSDSTVSFHQMRGTAVLTGRLGGAPVRAEGDGFFETWSAGPRPESIGSDDP
ncbi:MAG: hypothetical protein R3195_21025 [Gemmatimonadota bacterium]|nr:hypothetical protein [Gemmatimonadota bacterium]